MIMKRYALFCWEDHSAGGGWNDLRDTYDNAQDAHAEGQRFAASDYGWSCFQVIDLTTGQEITTPN